PASGGPASGGPASGPASGTVPTLPEPDPPPHAQMTAAAATPTAPARHHVMTDLRDPGAPRAPKSTGRTSTPRRRRVSGGRRKKNYFFFRGWETVFPGTPGATPGWGVR